MLAMQRPGERRLRSEEPKEGFTGVSRASVEHSGSLHATHPTQVLPELSAAHELTELE